LSTALANAGPLDTGDAPLRKSDDLPIDEVGRILEESGTERVERVISLLRQDRLYSTIWSAEVTHPAGRASYMLKLAGGSADKAIWLSQRADRLLASSPLHVPLGLRRHGPTGLIISRRFEGESLADLLIAGARSNPLSWGRRLETAVALAGEWLATYHALERRSGSIMEPLRAYVAGCSAEFKALPPLVRSAFERLLAEDIIDDLVVTHSDFTPGNILTDGAKACIIDFGVREWTELSPWWDLATLDVVLERFFRCDKAVTGFWLKPLFPRIRAAFFEAYGASADKVCRSRAICTAARHLSLGGKARAESRYRWHIRHITNVLSQY
jgi:hypothetical protein